PRGATRRRPRFRRRLRSGGGGHMKSGTGNTSDIASQSRIDRGNIRTGHDAEALAEAVLDNLHYRQATLPRLATRNDWYMALAYAVRDRMMGRYIATVEEMTAADTTRKIVAYLSSEVLTGPP